MMDQTSFLQWLTSQQQPVLNGVAKVITLLGGEEFYLVAIPIIYWCFSKAIGFRLFYAFALSMYVNSYLKFTVASPRPVGTEGVSSLFTESASDGASYPNDSFPSGHAQGTTTFWTYLAGTVRHPLIWVLAVIMIVLVGSSRMFLGLHWPTDVLGGIGVGLGVCLVVALAERMFPMPSPLLKMSVLLAVPVVLIFLFTNHDTAKVTGVLLGAGLGHLLEDGKIKMSIPAGWMNRIVAFLIGIAGVLLIKSGLKSVLPEGLWYEFLRYACIGIWVVGIAPWVFVLLRLYGREGRSFRHYP